MNDIDLLFSGAGGKFCIPPNEFRSKLGKAKAIIFDWDGVFNDGLKTDATGSPFYEPDAMGVNLLRLSFWLADKKMPPVAILTGEENKAGLYLAKREHYAAVYFKSTNKLISFRHFIREHKLLPEEVVFVFDDALDLSVAELCGLRIQVNRQAGVLFNQYVTLHQLADYVTASEGGNFAVREACELLMGMKSQFDNALRERMLFGPTYQNYLTERNSIQTAIYSALSGEVRPVAEP